MTARRRLTLGLAMSGLAAALQLAASGPGLLASRAELPAKLSDQDFWALSQDLSEPNGNFQSDNLLSNETGYQVVIPQLVERLGAGGVYMGVGPEQNFTYIAALKPRIAFIVDVRRGNRDLHLMYKALFEMAADRAEFLSLLFARPKPPGLSKDTSVRELFAAFDGVTAVDADYQRNLTRITDLLVKSHHLPLTDEEVQGIEYIYSNFYRFGPGIGYSSSRSGRGNIGPTYASLMSASDGAGTERSYLASEASFNVLKNLEAANMLVPAVGNFSGPKAVRGVGAWLRERNATVSAYYLSNVEDYLSRDGTWLDFCRNAQTLPLDDKSTFIRSGGGYRAVNGAAFGGGAYRPGAGVSSGVTPIPPDQLAQVLARGGGVITLPDGRTVSVSAGTAGVGMAANRLGLMHDDLAPCAAPKLTLVH